MNLRHIRRVAISVFLLGGLTLAAYLLHLQHSGNFHTVVADQVYRSNQPTPERLARYQKSRHIQAVLSQSFQLLEERPSLDAPMLRDQQTA